jgi:hypothetical protein
LSIEEEAWNGASRASTKLIAYPELKTLTSVEWCPDTCSLSPSFGADSRYRFALGEILEKVGMHGLDHKTIAVRAQEGQKEEAELGKEGKEGVNEKDLFADLENTHIRDGLQE